MSSNKQVKIKEVIETLCMLFNYHGYPKLPAEVLRQAKFNHNEAVLPLLDLTFCIVTMATKTISKEWNAHRKFSFVLAALRKLGYPRLVCVFCEELHQISSKELLLAFGYLIVKLDVFDHLRSVAKHLITKRMFATCETRSKRNILSVPKGALNLDHCLRLSKMIDFTTREMTSCCSYLESLLRKFSSVDKCQVVTGLQRGETLKKVSVTVLDMIFFENLLLQRDCIELLTKQVGMLRLHVKWTQCEPLFWKWMSSIHSKHVSLEHVSGIDSTTVNPRVVYGVQKSRERYLLSVVEHVLLRQEFCFDREEIEDVYQRELSELQSEVNNLEEQNKDWLCNFLHQHFPSVIQLPGLKSSSSR